MNIIKKKIYYKFIDLQRASYYLEDKPLFRFARKIAEKLKSIDDDEFDNPCRLHLFDEEELNLINEFFKKGTIALVDDCIAKLPTWLWLIIKPEFLNLNELRQIININNIRSKDDLCDYYKSKESVKQYGKEYSSLYSYFITNQDGNNFPIEYRTFPDNKTVLIKNINGIAIKGNFHNHTLYSDGRCSMEELKELARKANREFIGISDHSHYVGGVSSEYLIKQIQEIDVLNQKEGPKILKSIECEILKDGSLDMDNAVLSQLDYVIVACHRDELMIKSESTSRIIKAIENDNSKILAHPFARIYRKKAGLYLDIHKVIDACVKNHVAIEINGDPDRLDLAPEYIRYAVNRGTLFTVDSDTHKEHSFKNINNAIRIAEDYSIPTELVLNVKTMKELKIIFGTMK